MNPVYLKLGQCQNEISCHLSSSKRDLISKASTNKKIVLLTRVVILQLPVDLLKKNISVVNRVMEELEKKKKKIIGKPFRQCFLVSGKAITRRYKETITMKSTGTLTHLSFGKHQGKKISLM